MQSRQFPSQSQAEEFPSYSQTSNCFITFDYGSGLENFLFTIEKKPGRKIIKPGAPEHKGYFFGGWFLDSDLAEAYDFNAIVSSDNFTLYAKWVAQPYKITYYLNVGVNHPQNPEYYSAAEPDIVLQKPARGGDVFIGWYSDALFSQDQVVVICTNEARNITLHAKFLSKRELLEEKKIAEALYEGEPKLYLTPDGAELRYVSGQPVMERGLENHALISLFTKEGWAGNVFLPLENKVGSDFEETCSGAITLSKLADIENSAVRALASKAFQRVEAVVHNPKSDNLKIEATVHDGGVLSLTREGALWRNQRDKA